MWSGTYHNFNIYFITFLGIHFIYRSSENQLILNFNFVYFAYLYLFFMGLFDNKNYIKHILSFIIILNIINILLLGSSLEINSTIINYNFNSLDNIIALSFSYLLGFQYSKNLNERQIIYKKTEYIILILLLIFVSMHLYIDSEIEWLKTFLEILPISDSVMFVALYIGLKYKNIGLISAIIWMLFAIFILKIYNFQDQDIMFKNANILFFPILSLSHYFYTFIFILFGYLIKKIQNYNIDTYDKYLIKSVNANNIINIYVFLIAFFPIIILLSFLSQISTLEGDFGKELINILVEGRENKIYLVIFFLILIYITIIYIPIILSEGIVKRNGVIFNQDNFPKYTKIHNILDQEFGLERKPLYLISPNKILIWAIITSRAFKIYSALNPALLSPVFNEITKYDENQLLYLTYRQYSKMKLKHIKLWWYMYILTFIPILNILYFYVKRLTYMNATLYTVNKLINYKLITIENVIDAIVTEETEAGVQNISRNSIKINGLRNIFFLWLEYFTSRPHLQTQLYLINSFYELKHILVIKETSFGYNFK